MLAPVFGVTLIVIGLAMITSLSQTGIEIRSKSVLADAVGS